ncbi:tetratricopeptide repeat protein [Sulfobacillus harzensis]|uniref:Tetratricopeptide repeat protein n=1 Tax=Sulfobacillus harzensis TaxID=2729629 RepID=A0A7Y0L4R0_9FIRM|nr:tetratricopeptide repeat protein [Sulfobacillus harzensis]NMP22365.1 tetratricopeptide repeat protein [Sulfobacillus harzensis]
MSALDEGQKGWASVEVQDWADAEKHFRKALEMDPFQADALTGMAALYLRAGDADQARELCELATAQAERDLPRTKRHTGWDDEQVRPYLRALYYLSLTYIEQHAWALAQPALEEIVAWDVTGMQGRALDLLAQVLYRIERWEEAVHAFLEAAEYIPEDYYSAGLTLFKLGRTREAERFWRRGLERRPRLAALIAHYPHVLVNPRGSFWDQEFRDAVKYLQHQAELWDAASQRELAGFQERRAISNG